MLRPAASELQLQIVGTCMALIQLSRPGSITLRRLADELRREFAAANRIDGQLVDRDIAARRHEAVGGRLWANQRGRIQRQLERLRITENDWCKRELGSDIGTMRRRVQLAKGWDQYERNRRNEGDNGQYGLYYALSLIRTQVGAAMSAGRSRTRSVSKMPNLDITRCQFTTGDALDELRKLESGSVNTIITSPAYWPIKRTYGGAGIGYEATVAEYLSNIVAIMHEGKRALKDDGTLWIVIGDSYSRPAKFWTPQTDTRKRPDLQKHLMPVNRRIQAGDRPTGNLLMIPSRLALALQDDGWILRQAIVWDKVWGRPEAVTDRATQTYEMIFMLVKKSGYFYDQDPLRVPSVTSRRKPGKQKAGMIRRDANRTDLRVLNNPLGRNAPSVWQIRQANYVGKHPATFPTELVRRIIVTSCDTDSLVIDPFGGAGTTALVALQLGHRAITIDIHKAFTDEARERLSNAPAHCEAIDLPQPMELAAD
jgi:DNA modification methylase